MICGISRKTNNITSLQQMISSHESSIVSLKQFSYKKDFMHISGDTQMYTYHHIDELLTAKKRKIIFLSLYTIFLFLNITAKNH